MSNRGRKVNLKPVTRKTSNNKSDKKESNRKDSNKKDYVIDPKDTSKYMCPRCGYTKDNKALLEKHLERKTKCSPLILDIPVSEYVDELMTEEVFLLEGYEVCIIKALNDKLIQKRLDSGSDNIDEDCSCVDADYVSENENSYEESDSGSGSENEIKIEEVFEKSEETAPWSRPSRASRT